MGLRPAPDLFKSIRLDPFQRRAIDAIDRRDSVLVCAPTGAGKTLIAEYAVEKAILEGRRAIYTAPIKALSNQKFRDFSQAYGDRIGIKTGDVTINPGAPVVLMTTEIFRNTIFESPENLDGVEVAIFDEIHYLDDIDRGTVWEESLIFAPKDIRMVCLSATVPNAKDLGRWITDVRGGRLEVVEESNRPVPLVHLVFVPGTGVTTIEKLRAREREGKLPGRRRGFPDDARWRADLIRHLADEDRLPALFFVFNRRDCRDFARRVRAPLVTERESRRLLEQYDRLCAQFGIGRDGDAFEMRALIGRGVAFHHAGLMPTLKEVIERLFTTGLVKLLFATETFAVGVNMPARSVVFNSIEKFDGVRNNLLRSREHAQMSGRAGRRGIDPVGYVYSVAYWPAQGAGALTRVVEGELEPIRSQFNLSYSTILSLYRHLGDRVPEACEKSFAYAGGRKRRFEERQMQVKKRMTILGAFHYIRDGQITERGRFAMGQHGYEMQVTELYFRGMLDRLDEAELAALFTAIVYEAKRADWHAKPTIPSMKWIQKAAKRAVDDVIEAELALRLDEVTKPIDFKIMMAAWAWATGEPFADLGRFTSVADGDLVRCFRMTTQLLRQTADLLPKDAPLRRRLRGACERLNRDEVDAERQLRLGLAEPAAGA